jgi:hypothetical protein
MKQSFLSASLVANTVGNDVTPTIIKQAPFERVLRGVCVSGATINTGTLHILKNNLEVLKMTNGVTRTAGQPIDLVSDLVPVNESVAPNDQLTFTIDNTTGGALTFYVAYDIDESQE